MRVWILENVPDYEQGTRLGVFGSPDRAWDRLYEELDRQVYVLPSFSVEAHQRCDAGKDDVRLEIVHYSDDRLRLVGLYVEETGYPDLTATEAREFQEVAALVAQHATHVSGFAKTTLLPWDVRRTDDLTAHWRFVKSG